MALIKFIGTGTGTPSNPLILDVVVPPVVSHASGALPDYDLAFDNNGTPDTVAITVTDPGGITTDADIYTTINDAIEVGIADPYIIPTVSATIVKGTGHINTSDGVYGIDDLTV